MSSFEYFFIVLFIIITTIYVVVFSMNMKKENYNVQKKSDSHSKCSVNGCDSLDPVSDPKYNMQQIVKQSILLEEHLANKNKRCRDCITKHFLHIIGLAEEAQMLATKNIEKYPLVTECVELYNRLFQKWLKEYDINVEYNSLDCCNELRVMRKKLIAIYFFDDNINY